MLPKEIQCPEDDVEKISSRKALYMHLTTDKLYSLDDGPHNF